MLFLDKYWGVYTFGEILSLIHTIIVFLTVILYTHFNLFLIMAPFVKEKKEKEAKKDHTYGFVICAHNEEKVIGNLIESIHKQNYNNNLIKIFVCCDNCDDNTKEVAFEKGAICFERKNKDYIGKSYALDYVFKNILEKHTNEVDAFIIMDADNLVDKDFLKEMNKSFDSGKKIISGFRNAKNYGENFLTSGCAMLYFREMRIMHEVRSRIGSTVYASGTGFLIDYSIIKENNGWPYHLLIEDVEFSIDQVLKGEKVYFQKNAVYYDEHTPKLIDSWNQRMRWCKGNHQCFFKYSGKLFKHTLRNKSFSSYDLIMHTIPTPAFMTIWLFLLFILYSIYAIIRNVPFNIYYVASINPIIDMIVFSIIYTFINAIITTILLWNNIKATTFKKILYCFTFPFYMLMYIPINTISLFKKVKWKKVEHNNTATIEQIN